MAGRKIDKAGDEVLEAFREKLVRLAGGESLGEALQRRLDEGKPEEAKFLRYAVDLLGEDHTYDN